MHLQVTSALLLRPVRKITKGPKPNGGKYMKRIQIYPLLLVTAIILDRIVNSMTQINPKESVRSLFILLFLCSMVSVMIQRFVKDWHRTNFVVFIMVVLFVFYRSFYVLLERTFPQQADYLGLALIIVLMWIATVLTSRKVWLSIRKPAIITNYFNLVCVFLLLFQVLQLGEKLYFLDDSKTYSTAILPLTEEIHLKSDTRPDIYVIILDGYGRQDVLKTIYDYDNSGFISELEKRDFYVPTQNHSNYVQTAYAMASLWNFEYVQPWMPPSDYRQYLIQPIQRNRAFQLLDDIGYTTVSFEGTLGYTQIDQADVLVSEFLPINKFEALLLMDSPLEPISNILDLNIPLPTHRTRQRTILYKLDELKNVPASIPGPKIVYDHILLPHPPFEFDRDGNILPQKQPYNMWDDSETAGGEYEYQKGYREQVIFANRKILEAIDAILAKSETQPIILLMGDHGPASMFHFDIDSPGCLWERTSNLYALLLPGHQQDGTVYETITPVNTFRVIFNTYFGTELPLLEDRTYLASAAYRDTIKDITDSRDSQASCTVSD